MALANRPRNSPNDENSQPAAKTLGNGPQGTGRLGGLKSQQSITSDRKILSDISNTKLRVPKPSPKPGLSVFQSENLPSKVAGPPPSSAQKTVTRAPLKNLNNVEKLRQSFKRKSAIQVTLTSEEIAQAEEWAKEDLPIEKTHFTGEDGEALRKKRIDAEIEATVASTRNYNGAGTTGPYWVPAVDDVESIFLEDGRLKADPSPFDEDRAQPMDIDMDLEDDLVLLSILEPREYTEFPCVRDDWTFIPRPDLELEAHLRRLPV